MKKKTNSYLIVVALIFTIVSTNCAFATPINFPLTSKEAYKEPSTLSSKNSSSISSSSNTVQQSNTPQSDKVDKDNNSESKILAPMAEKHIFSPEPDGSNSSGIMGNPEGLPNNAQQSIDMLMQKVKREIELTGIVITPVSKKAMILHKGKVAAPSSVNKQVPDLYESGSSIGEYLLKEVFSNYVVIAQNNLEIKLGLFTEKNNRPEQPKENLRGNSSGQGMAINQQDMVNSGNPPDGIIMGQDGTPPINAPMPINPESIQDINIQKGPKSIEDGNVRPEPPNPFVRAMQDSANQRERDIPDDNNSFNNTDGSMGNPFLQAIQRARERQRTQQQ
ncbi:MAG: hypothetical protein HQK63_01155 [Desulfamplus sp.]|nr:hypothetical protein [Desulfamplus sp.]